MEGEYTKKAYQLTLEFSYKVHEIMIQNFRAHHILTIVGYDITFEKWLEIN